MPESQPAKLETVHHPPASGDAAKKLVVLLHGYGADMHDLIGLAPHWADSLPDAEFLSPNAPESCAEHPIGRQWFPVGNLDLGDMHAGVLSAAPILNRFLDDELAKRGLTERDLALVGFSQGTMMALHVGLRRSRAPAGIIGYSGVVVGAEQLAQEIQVHPPVLLVHGEADPLIPVVALTMTQNVLTAAGIAVKSHVSQGLGHGIDTAGLALGGRFLAEAFAASARG
ncbi:MAG: dienelactone hydrolase family protein [Alphaproteobacteria bacterium]|nr:dienelactone hydrolase family protein [Alphaproteobacteria bacterium]